MAQDREIVKSWSCPWCFRKGNDSAPLVYDKKRASFHCVKCCFTGTEDEIVAEYRRYQSKYRLMETRLNLLARQGGNGDN